MHKILLEIKTLANITYTREHTKVGRWRTISYHGSSKVKDLSGRHDNNNMKAIH